MAERIVGLAGDRGLPATIHRVDVISGYVGSVELFEAAGFERASATTGRSGGRPRWVMRLDLR